MIVQSPDEELDKLLASCAEEKIQALGMIQSHGILMVLAPKNLKILQVSANAAQFFNLTLETILGKDAIEILGSSSSSLFKSVPSGPPASTEIEIKGQRFSATVHQNSGGIILELEPLPNKETVDISAFHLNMHFYFAALLESNNEKDLLNVLVQQTHNLTGFDRTLAYSFGKDFNGTVLAETRNDNMLSYLGHSFPASDIPSQARDLYIKNTIRQIVSVNDVPVPVLPPKNPITGDVIDLTFSILRSVSPIHIEYMKNMEIESGISVSLIVKGKLWGLISFHNLTSKLVTRDIRAACAALCKAACIMLERFEEERCLQESLKLEQANLNLMRKLTKNADIMLNLISPSPNLLDIVPASGACVSWEGRLACIGDTPDDKEILALINWLNQTANTPHFQTEFLSSIYSRGEKIADKAAGILAVKLSSKVESWLIWFRAEIVQEIAWAGNPHKPLRYENDKAVLSPRQSFGTWKELVKGKSRSFSNAEITSAGTLLSNLQIMEHYHNI